MGILVAVFTEATRGKFGWLWRTMRRLLGWKVNHAGLTIGWEGETWVYEARWRGVAKVPLSEKRKEGGELFFFLFKRDLTGEEVSIVLALAEAAVGIPYDWLGIIAALRYWAAQLWRRRAVALWAPFYHCSGFVAEVCRGAGRPISDAMPIYVSPQMIHVSDHLMLFGQ